MNTRSVTAEDRGPVRILTLNRPERLNAINGDLVSCLRDGLEAAMAAESVGSIVITGAGTRAFCAGDDLDENLSALAEADLRAGVEQLQDITRSICFGPKPVIAAVNGWAVGGGFEWVVNCDFSIWSEDAAAFMPELDWGLFVTGAVTVLLPGLIGRGRAREMLFLGRKVNAEEAEQWGLAYRSVPAARLLEEAIALGGLLEGKPAAAAMAFKRGLVASDRGTIERALQFEAEMLIETIRNPESRRRIEAYLGREKAAT